MTLTRTLRIGMLLLLVMVLLITAACGKQPDPDAVPDEPDVVQEQPTEPEPEPEPPGFPAPLTGVRLEEESKARPIAVMVNNFPAARPQSGLTKADVLWEVLAEGGITRIVAVFQSAGEVETIGPVRSIRPYMIDLSEMYGSVIAHAGASHDGYFILQRQKKPYLDEISNAGTSFWRDKSRKAPHNLYTSLEKLREGAERKKYEAEMPIPVMRYMKEALAPDGIDALKVEIRFQMKNYKVSYTYDAETQLYARFINGEPHAEREDAAQQLRATNLVVLGTSHKVLDKEGRLEMDLTSGGPAMLLQLGKMVEGVWSRGEDGMIRILKDGVELPFAPGKTFYHVVPNDPMSDHVVMEE